MGKHPATVLAKMLGKVNFLERPLQSSIQVELYILDLRPAESEWLWTSAVSRDVTVPASFGTELIPAYVETCLYSKQHHLGLSSYLLMCTSI